MSFRAFIAVDLGGRLGADRVFTELSTSGADLKVVEPGKMHITLKFLGETDEGAVGGILQDMEVSSQGIAPFELAFEGMGAFPDMGRIRVVWIGLKGAEPLVEVARRLEELLAGRGHAKEGRFSPHITVARVRGPRNKDRLQDILGRHAGERFGTMTVDRILLKKSVLSSAGPTYSTVGESPLAR